TSCAGSWRLLSRRIKSSAVCSPGGAGLNTPPKNQPPHKPNPPPPKKTHKILKKKKKKKTKKFNKIINKQKQFTTNQKTTKI
ncbi:hypothetical protein ACVGXX_11295, partial [Enterobacter intestinihominis]